MTAMWSALASLLETPLFGLTVTVGTFWLAQRLWQVTGRRSALNPVLLAVVAIGALLLLTGIPYSQYMAGARFIDLLLGPATVALALPLHRHWDRVKQAAPMILGGVAAGCVAAVAAGYGLTHLLGGSDVVARSMLPKSATSPVSLALSAQLGGIPSLSVAFTILAGVVGGVAAPTVLDLCRLRDERARGLAIGVASHGIGTVRALEESETEGAFSGLAMGLNALATSLVVGVLVQLWGF